MLRERFLNNIMLIIDIIDKIYNPYENNFHELTKWYRRLMPDHHANYIKIQELLWNKIKHIEGVLPHREPFLNQLYVRDIDVISDLIRTNQSPKRKFGSCK